MKCLGQPNREYPLARKIASGNVIGNVFYKTKWGRRRLYRCGACGKTFRLNPGTPCYRLQHRRKTFDEEDTSILNVSFIERLNLTI